ncbi:type II toxin-antitoxin system death-on-curing family toxin [Mucilaginibacter gotjawali]|uniref:Toxin Doc n=2 Tax=Mucilaginibacter gotjawali TaxID=1550579 RepID=A0A0X8X8A7_9SPHI|nr:type II toxin-antitoxin system death-on-curing family toxin [Mucilaginibacter gotjawali]MBB3057607.1 death-on-curing protein [Mucilaginibacter gotjawali]BAU55269.1 Toxin Doc [Mucilaginibacter gotjawali]
MIDLNEVLDFHNELIDKHGGANGIRDKNLLLSALARPYMTFNQQELYSTPSLKAAAIFESIVINHPFMDGNKRTAFLLLRLILQDYDYDISAGEDDKYEMTISASMGNLRFEGIVSWIEERLIINK